MAQLVINVGLLPNDGAGDTHRDAFIKVNTNIAELYTLVAVTGASAAADAAAAAASAIAAEAARVAAVAAQVAAVAAETNSTTSAGLAETARVAAVAAQTAAEASRIAAVAAQTAALVSENAAATSAAAAAVSAAAASPGKLLQSVNFAPQTSGFSQSTGAIILEASGIATSITPTVIGSTIEITLTSYAVISVGAIAELRLYADTVAGVQAGNFMWGQVENSGSVSLVVNFVTTSLATLNPQLFWRLFSQAGGESVSMNAQYYNLAVKEIAP